MITSFFLSYLVKLYSAKKMIAYNFEEKPIKVIKKVEHHYLVLHLITNLHIYSLRC
jgi:hypothetical protein